VTGNRNERQLARERQAQLGCNYTTALRQVRAEYEARQLAEARECEERLAASEVGARVDAFLADPSIGVKLTRPPRSAGA
jgi:AraC-like DNA-binding protein